MYSCSPAFVYSTSKAIDPSALFLAVPTTSVPSFSSNSYWFSFKSLPSNTFLALIVAFVAAALYVFVNVGLLSVTAASSCPCPLSVTFTFTV